MVKIKTLPEEVQKIKKPACLREVAQKQRFYLQELAAHVLGISGIDNQGLEGSRNTTTNISVDPRQRTRSTFSGNHPFG